MQRKVKPQAFSLGEEEIKRRQEILQEAVSRFEKNLLMDIRQYLKQFGLEHLLKEANEIWHDTIVEALRHSQNYNPEWSAKAWLRGVAFNVVRHLRRDEKNKKHFVSISEAVQNFGFDGQTDETSETELFDFLHKQSVKSFFTKQPANSEEILALLDGDDRKILRWHFVGGLSGNEIASELGISEGAANTRLSRAKTRLRKVYQDNQYQ